MPTNAKKKLERACGQCSDENMKRNTKQIQTPIHIQSYIYKYIHNTHTHTHTTIKTKGIPHTANVKRNGRDNIIVFDSNKYKTYRITKSTWPALRCKESNGHEMIQS